MFLKEKITLRKEGRVGLPSDGYHVTICMAAHPNYIGKVSWEKL